MEMDVFNQLVGPRTPSRPETTAMFGCRDRKRRGFPTNPAWPRCVQPQGKQKNGRPRESFQQTLRGPSQGFQAGLNVGSGSVLEFLYHEKARNLRASAVLPDEVHLLQFSHWSGGEGAVCAVRGGGTQGDPAAPAVAR